MTRILISRTASIIALLIATLQTASAQVAPAIVIAFDVPGPVPVGSWGIAVAALFIGVAASYFLRSRQRAVSRMLAIGAVAIAATLSLNAYRAEANLIPIANLLVSPTTLLGVGTGLYMFANGASAPIVLRSVTLMDGGSLTIEPVSTTCRPFTILNVAQTCTVAIIGSMGG